MEISIKEFNIINNDTITICFVIDGDDIYQTWETSDKSGSMVKLLEIATTSLSAEELPTILEECATQKSGRVLIDQVAAEGLLSSLKDKISSIFKGKSKMPDVKEVTKEKKDVISTITTTLLNQSWMDENLPAERHSGLVTMQGELGYLSYDDFENGDKVLGLYTTLTNDWLKVYKQYNRMASLRSDANHKAIEMLIKLTDSTEEPEKIKAGLEEAIAIIKKTKDPRTEFNDSTSSKYLKLEKSGKLEDDVAIMLVPRDDVVKMANMAINFYREVETLSKQTIVGIDFGNYDHRWARLQTYEGCSDLVLEFSNLVDLYQYEMASPSPKLNLIISPLFQLLGSVPNKNK